MRLSIILLNALALVAICGCNNAPGRPSVDSAVLRPNKVLNFDALYQENCAGCHGAQGKGGAAVGLNSQVYLAIADDATIRRVTAEGVPGTAMPAFAQSSGGTLTDEQIDSIVTGIRARWARRDSLDISPPSYAALAAGDPKRGVEVYGTYCMSCHGAAGRGGTRAGPIADQSYLTLVTDQYLRTIVIAGRTEMGAPDWRGNVPGKAMSQDDVSDVVAWLSAQRPKVPSQLFSRTRSATGGIQ
jgi:cytochrome c oxidase cbb3-type subunit III